MARKISPTSLRSRLLNFLKRSGVFCSLRKIYKKMGAEDVAMQAAIRGILNRDVAMGGVFERNPRNRGEYRYRRFIS